jgi:hypothetical protein
MTYLISSHSLCIKTENESESIVLGEFVDNILSPLFKKNTNEYGVSEVTLGHGLIGLELEVGYNTSTFIRTTIKTTKEI